ncbi:hypothetical protein Dsin_030033 [Dipteronia sinensis]|uniref:Uncharacterized protein n=1 Tax=Dipteronia sinensis TaxID=43782 RepID=A0AAE0DQU6_9ROSI|nr:hypothetical protein Dsin_030033 [Dipteronia sinensis]
MWRSILWGRSLLQKGLRWRAGNGQQIRTFKDPWLSRPFSFRPISMDPGEDIRVEYFINKDLHYWDFQKLNEFFLDLDKELICSIPVGFQEKDDCLSGILTKQGLTLIKVGIKRQWMQSVKRLAQTQKLNNNCGYLSGT